MDSIKNSKAGLKAAGAIAQHTPGPWTSEEWRPQTIDQNGMDIATVACARRNWRANARLIAAAPEMLAALGYMADFLRLNGPETEPSRYALAKINAAIAKATGGAL